VNSHWLALGLTLVCAITARAQDKMPVPVEDDTNAPPALRHAAQETPPPPAPRSGPTAEAPPEVSQPGTPYSQAMVAYKAGDYDKAFAALEGTDPTTQDDNFVILESRIFTELKRYDDGEKLLKERIQLKEQQQAKPAELDPLFTALGDLLLHKRAFDRAAKFYAVALTDKPNDPDLTLKLLYTHIGNNDLRGADQIASTFSPFDAKNPYDDHPVYYFARAAVAQALGRTQDAEDDIQQARTNYGITVTNRYLKTYLHLFAAPDQTDKVPSALAPAPPTKP
jgi:tetratricopeptide (TPR) repeat protein